MCCICLIEDNKNYITLDCGHKLHKFCLKELLEYIQINVLCRQKIYLKNMYVIVFLFTSY